MIDAQLIFSARKGSLNIHHLGSTPFFLCLWYFLFADYVEGEHRNFSKFFLFVQTAVIVYVSL